MRAGAALFHQMKRALLASAVLLVAAGAMVTGFTAVTYAATCSQLTGFPGLLQRAGFVAAGPCTKEKSGACSSDACTATNRKPGKCKNIAVRGPVNCACVESTVSSGLQ
jgi:hypothetical protein